MGQLVIGGLLSHLSGYLCPFASDYGQDEWWLNGDDTQRWGKLKPWQL